MVDETYEKNKPLAVLFANHFYKLLKSANKGEYTNNAHVSSYKRQETCIHSLLSAIYLTSQAPQNRFDGEDMRSYNN